jgi:hypothetical protein
MLSEFAQDLVDPDQPVRDAFTERPGKPLKIRVQPMLLRATGGKGQYQAWKQVRWTLDCDSPAEALAVKAALRAFFEAMVTHGPEAVHAALSKAGAGKDAAA